MVSNVKCVSFAIKYICSKIKIKKKVIWKQASIEEGGGSVLDLGSKGS